MKLFVTADTHLSASDKTLTICSRSHFSSIEEWNAYCIDRINSTVDRNDRLIINGDFAFDRVGFWRQQIRCKHIMLILGNHDPEPKCRNVFGGNIRVQYLTKICKVKTFVTHYPTAFWNGSHKGFYHLYGHIHNHERREAELNTIWPGRRSLDVSVDSAYALLGDWRPFAETEIHDLLKDKPGHDPV